MRLVVVLTYRDLHAILIFEDTIIKPFVSLKLSKFGMRVNT
jgi:hypothetical protein